MSEDKKKQCNDCGELLGYDSYSVNKATRDGYSNKCKVCYSRARKIKRDAKNALNPKPKYVIKAYKACNACKETFHLSSFNKSGMTRDGREGTCRSCRTNKRKQNAAAYHASGVIKTSKKCSKCKEERSIHKFSKDSTRDDGFSTSCKDCHTKYNVEYMKSDHAKAAARISSAKYKEANPNIGKEHYKKNRKRILKRHKEHSLTHNGRFVSLRSGAKSRGIYFELTKEFMIANWNADCNYCGVKLDIARFDRVDSDKGYTEANVVPCCKNCNYVKLTHTPEFLLAHLRKMIKQMDKNKIMEFGNNSDHECNNFGYKKGSKQKPLKRARSRNGKRYGVAPGERFTSLRRGADRRGIYFGLTKEFVISNWNAECHYCGVELDMSRFDRIDSDGGYTEDNVVPCCGTCNFVKHVHTPEFILDHIKKMVKKMSNDGGISE